MGRRLRISLGCLPLSHDFRGKYEIELVCHYIDELPFVEKAFPGTATHYSYDAKDYIDVYRKYDFVIGPRIHGIGISASMGIPGMVIKHDFRGDAADGFLAEKLDITLDLDRAIEKIKRNIDLIESKNIMLLEHKRNTQQEYVALLGKALFKLI